MAADASIYANALARPKSVLEYAKEYGAQDDARMDRQINRLKITQAQQDMADQQGLRNYLATAPDLTSKEGQAGLYKAAPMKAGGILKSQAEANKEIALTSKAQADTQKSQLDAATKRIEIAGNAFGAVRANPTVETAHQAIDYLAQNGVWTPEQAAQYKQQVAANPQSIAALAEQGFRAATDAKTQLDQVWKQKADEVERQRLAEMSRHNQSTEALTARGQNMVDRRASEGLALQREAARQQIVETENGPVLVDKGTGGARAVTIGGKPLPPKDKPLNEGQSKAALFGSRMQAANTVFDQLAREGTTTANPGMRTPVIGGVITAMSSSNQQALDQAKRDFINAVLRRESGAVIADSEFDNAEKQYFPQIGDSKAVIAQKRSNRERAMRGILEEVPEKQRERVVSRINGGAPVNMGGASGGWSIQEVK